MGFCFGRPNRNISEDVSNNTANNQPIIQAKNKNNLGIKSEEIQSIQKNNSQYYTSRKILIKADAFTSRRIKEPGEGEEKSPEDKLFEILTKAKEEKDIKTLIKHMNDETELFNNIIEFEHPWAASPKTLGSLASFYISLCLLGESEMKDDEQKKANFEEGKESNLGEKVKKNLQSQYQDMREITLLVSLFLLEGNIYGQEYFYEENIVNVFFTFLEKEENKIGVKITSVQCLREIFNNKPKYCVEICKGVFLDYVIDILKIEENSLLLFEILYCIDILMTIVKNEEAKQNLEVLKIFEEKNIKKFVFEMKERVKKNENNNEKSEDSFKNKENVIKYAEFLVENLK